ncbi:MAG: hypothetical protein M3220_09625, partial [Chloroflexota bacterium]|nr:hypothetical protein [Chloroflexota bacterium]
GETWTRKHMHHAPANAGIAVQHFVRSTNREARDLLEAHSYTPVRTHYWMTVDMNETPPPPVWPEGIVVHSFVPRQGDQALFEAGEESFQDIWGRPQHLRSG